MMVDLPQGVSEVFDNTWQLEAKGVRSLGRDQRGYRCPEVRFADMHLTRLDLLKKCGILSYFKISNF
jgi:hypothetical protein